MTPFKSTTADQLTPGTIIMMIGGVTRVETAQVVRGYVALKTTDGMFGDTRYTLVPRKDQFSLVPWSPSDWEAFREFMDTI